jgi:hypothetical protein
MDCRATIYRKPARSDVRYEVVEVPFAGYAVFDLENARPAECGCFILIGLPERLASVLAARLNGVSSPCFR